jgi:hypothetical protein
MTMIHRIISYWVYGGFLGAFLLLGLMPICWRSWSLPLILVFLQLPVYMLHQLEEHDDDRFRNWVNRVLGGGRELLSKTAVFVINVPGVWGVNLVSLLLAATLDLGFGLISIYLTIVNGIVHVVQAIRMKGYNPGLITAILLFLPVGGLALWTIHAAGTISLAYDLLGFGTAIAIHLAIVAHVVIRMRRAPNFQS